MPVVQVKTMLQFSGDGGNTSKVMNACRSGAALLHDINAVKDTYVLLSLN